MANYNRGDQFKGVTLTPRMQEIMDRLPLAAVVRDNQKGRAFFDFVLHGKRINHDLSRLETMGMVHKLHDKRSNTLIAMVTQAGHLERTHAPTESDEILRERDRIVAIIDGFGSELVRLIHAPNGNSGAGNGSIDLNTVLRRLAYINAAILTGADRSAKHIEQIEQEDKEWVEQRQQELTMEKRKAALGV